MPLACLAHLPTAPDGIAVPVDAADAGNAPPIDAPSLCSPSPHPQYAVPDPFGVHAPTTSACNSLDQSLIVPQCMYLQDAKCATPCGQCIYGTETTAPPPPIVKYGAMDSYLPNLGGCVALYVHAAGRGSCAETAGKLQACEMAACAGCKPVNAKFKYAAYADCVRQADQGPCAGEYSAAFTCAGQQGGSYCFLQPGETIEAQAGRLAALFCGPP